MSKNPVIITQFAISLRSNYSRSFKVCFAIFFFKLAEKICRYRRLTIKFTIFLYYSLYLFWCIYVCILSIGVRSLTIVCQAGFTQHTVSAPLDGEMDGHDLKNFYHLPHKLSVVPENLFHLP